MRNKIFLAAILLTPILVVSFSSLYFVMGNSPEGTKNNGTFFKSYFEFSQFKNEKGVPDLIDFDDGKWVLSVYVTNIEFIRTLCGKNTQSACCRYIIICCKATIYMCLL